MILKNAIKGIKYKEIIGNPDISIDLVTEDSRSIIDNSLFVAIKGEKFDGHLFIDKAINSGAKAIVAESISDIVEGICYIIVESSHEALGQLASEFYNHPSREMKVVGVTGTNGKTSIASLLYQMFSLAGYKVGLISTISNFIDKEEIPSTHTTPAAMPLQSLFRKMANAGCSYVFMEVSSHSVDQRRIAGIDFAGAIFTNLTRDHLDYHHTVENYLKAKKRFFDDLSPNAFALTNLDEKTGLVMLQNTKASKYTYSIKSGGDFTATILERDIRTTIVEIDNIEVSLNLIGDFNISNIMAVYSAARILGIEKNEALRLLSLLKPVNGRFQTLFSKKKQYTAIVDYAHTPDALINVLDTINALKKKNAKVISIVGAGGDRDKGKRPLMAEAALRRSDIVILSSDNPRSEDPNQIIADMKEGLDADLLSKSLSIVYRREAIKTACTIAKENDIVLIAGKGHETYQEIKGVKHHFDDTEVVKDIFDME